MKVKKNIILILDNLRSVQNTASLFRTADCAGVEKIYLVGTTPTPYDKFGKPRNDFVKISLGSEKTVPFVYVKTIQPLLKKLKKEGIQLCAIEQDTNSVHYKKAKYTTSLALIAGNEPYGIKKSVLSLTDTVVEIPQFGQKESLNVVVATAVVLFEIVS